MVTVTKEYFDKLVQMVKEEHLLFKESAIKFNFKSSKTVFYLCRASRIDSKKYIDKTFSVELFKKKLKILPLSFVIKSIEDLLEKEDAIIVAVRDNYIDFFKPSIILGSLFRGQSEAEVSFNTVSMSDIIEQLDKIQK